MEKIRCVNIQDGAVNFFVPVLANDKNWQRRTGYRPEPVPTDMQGASETATSNDIVKSPSGFDSRMKQHRGKLIESDFKCIVTENKVTVFAGGGKKVEVKIRKAATRKDVGAAVCKAMVDLFNLLPDPEPVVFFEPELPILKPLPPIDETEFPLEINTDSGADEENQAQSASTETGQGENAAQQVTGRVRSVGARRN